MPEPITTVVTQRAETVPESTVAHTPDTIPANIRVVAMNSTVLVLIRAARTYLTSLTGLLTAGMTGMDRGILPDDFGALLVASAGMALAPAVMSMLLNAGELLAKIDQSFPQVRA